MAKPDDKTLSGKPGFPDKLNESDTYAGMRTDTKRIDAREAAVEANQGAWRERAFTPRGVMPPEEIAAGMNGALKLAMLKQAPNTLLLNWLRENWLEYLRQAIEQAGGDSIDVWLTSVLKPPGRPGINLMLVEMYVNFARMRLAADRDSFFALARLVAENVKKGLDEPSRRRVSLKVLEKELEGKIDVDGLLLLLLSSDQELESKARDIGTTLERIRAELKTMPGAKPDGMYSNFARLKAEARVIDGELKRRDRSS